MTSSLPVVVIDNTLLSRLTQLGISPLLPSIFQQIRIPPEVRSEAANSPVGKEVFDLLNESSDFFIDCHEADITNKEILKTIVDEGEAAVIAQAEATLSGIITDDYKAYREAASRELSIFRTGKILTLLKEAGQISLVSPFLDKLINEMGFRLTHKDRVAILKAAGEVD